jgi:ABC-type nickel/cobalt efflux system permease component RcnA
MIAPLTGLIAGVIHVWSGPDHLAAIAPLAVRTQKRAWSPGLRWGIGHSAGVAAVGLLSLWLRDLLPVKLLSSWGERIVGVMLCGIGLWALRKALKVHAHEHQHDGTVHVHMHAHAQPVKHEKVEAHRNHTHAAFGIGVFHGLAGSSHFVGVLVALAFPTLAQAIGYLVAFGVGTVLSMASFSSIIGLLGSRCAIGSTRVYRGLMGFCAVTALVVGGFWLFQ